jgi:hypothetical protein
VSAKTVFISYRRDAVGKPFARTVESALTQRGYDVFLDVDSIEAGAWAEQIRREVPGRAHFLLLLTPGALDRCADADDWVRAEITLARESRRNIVPVREESVDLSALRARCTDGVRDVLDLQIAELRHGSFKRDMDTLIERYIPPHKAPAPPTAAVPAAAFAADIDRVVRYAPAELIGRDEELAVLNEAWDRAQRADAGRARVVTFVALGGEGKTSLVAKWTASLAARGWPGCETAFAWSFYSQGTREQLAASSDLFLAEALTFFGDRETAGSAKPALEKGRRLAHLVGARRALLLLDGLEPLQHAPTSPQAGELKDAGVSALLKALATDSRGLCVVTTRYSIADLRAFRQTTAPEKKLDRLSLPAGVALLGSLGVRGARREIERLVEDVKGHALTLGLLGTYLRDAHGGDVRRRDRVTFGEANDEQGGHAFHVMDAYVAWLEGEIDGGRANAGGDERGRRAVAALRLMGLFDRPASADCVAALMRAPAIAGLTEPLVVASEAQRNIALARLADASLLTVNRDAAAALASLDAHPLLREYFARQLRERHPDAWRAAHRRLYEHLCATTEDKAAPTLDDLQPLYQAVAHGCQAGMHREACNKVYFERILRGTDTDGFYSFRKLGAFGADLGAIACFFEQPWSRVSPALAESDHAWLLHQSAFDLRALGRVTEAREPMRAALEIAATQNDWGNAAIYAENLYELDLALGDLAAALRDAEASVGHADRSSNEFRRMSSRTAMADSRHQTGRRIESQAIFREAAAMQAEQQPEYPLLYSLQGFRYCDLLLAAAERAAWTRATTANAVGREGEPTTPASAPGDGDATADITACDAVAEDAAQTLKWARQSNASLLTIALSRLTLGCAALYASVLGSPTSYLQTGASHLDAAVDGLRRAGQQDYLARGLLSRAWLRALTGSFAGPDGAAADLDEAWEIAERGPMPLFLADIHLHRARLFHAVTPYPWSTAGADGRPRGPRDDLAAARALITRHGYLRRMEELENAEAALAGSPPPGK